MRQVRALFGSIDWWLISAVFLLTLMGLITLYTFDGDNYYFERQIIWIVVAFSGFALALIPDYRFLRIGNATFVIYLVTVLLLVLVLIVGETVKGAQSRFDFGFFSLQPSDPAKLVLIAILAKFFSKRHELIGDFNLVWNGIGVGN
jgi:rod shape determining protein RodA